ncbi:RAD51-like protein 1 [Marchantia polymorpha subsp. ruderalis]|uniref:RecA family profile 1 domain-containing protein n=2 Tax=Marchantia polymorpha TaxID=3197 RepID=A0AAF6AVY4_MARPO|nr:hypothetical protein MARPO_0007s0061 [Marchantia polymorpha]BBN03918.1 hypothetical protein Mp_3g00650 [Marchantia polymorpha subsp. ruderalis]|eukprot:PTQ47606.1 hypothetical protein MARPO_0007s0061 [Marchantia polymorpha]
MSRKLLRSMNLPGSTANVFSARSLHSAKDVLCKTELELMELLDMPLPVLSSVLARIYDCVCPPYRSVLSLWIERNAKEVAGGHLPTGLRELDHVMCGGVPFGLITEVVGAAGVGKSQMCLMLSVLTAMPRSLGGLDGSVIYIDTEHKFSPGRMMEIAQHKFPDIFRDAEMLQQLALRVLVLHPSSVNDLMESLRALEKAIIERSARLIVIDSVAALLQSEYGRDRIIERQEMLGQQATILKFLAEAFRIPVLVTNQVRTKSDNQWSGPASANAPHDAHNRAIPIDFGEGGLEQHLTAALGTKWAHSVNVRLVLECTVSGHYLIKIVKSPMSPSVSFPYRLTQGGLELDTDSRPSGHIKKEETFY